MAGLLSHCFVGRNLALPSGELSSAARLRGPSQSALRAASSLSPLSLRDIIPTPFALRAFPNRPLDKGSRPPKGEPRGNTNFGGRKFASPVKGEVPNEVRRRGCSPEPQSPSLAALDSPLYTRGPFSLITKGFPPPSPYSTRSRSPGTSRRFWPWRWRRTGSCPPHGRSR